MKPETRVVYEAYTNSDLTEGRGSHVHIAFCESRTTAQRLVQGRGVMGSDAYVQERTAHWYDGYWCLPFYLQGPSDEDKRLDDLHAKTQVAIAKAKAAGLTKEEIELIVKSGKP